MWTMGYNEAHEDDMNMNMNMSMSMLESYSTTNNGNRKLRPLVPRPPPASRFHDHLLPLNQNQNHHLAVEQHKREFNSQQMVVVSSRWNPTPEQLQSLEELYRRGTRTPSADEIQHITAHLRRYGKIEGKNVFYWFQNHKARERQKRRRQLDKEPPNFFINENINLQQSIQRNDSEVEGTRNWAIPTFPEKSLVRERTRKATDEGWIAVEEGDENDDQLHRRRKSFPATWNHILSSSNSCPTNPITLTNSTCSPTAFAPKTSSSVIVSSQRHQTLELFPVNTSNREQPEKCFLHTNDVNLNPRHFIEFLPLKQ